MEYILLRATHPTWLSLALPQDVADLINFHPENAPASERNSRTVAFLQRGAGIARILAAYPARHLLSVERVVNRELAVARLTEKNIFNLPLAVLRHLGIQVLARGPRAGRGTDDGLLWFLPAPEYYEFRAVEGAGRAWTGPSQGGLAHMYVMKSLYPFPPSLESLAEEEDRIESREWAPVAEVFQRVGRARRGL